MRWRFAALLVLLLASPAAAADWRFEHAGVPGAFSDNGAAQLDFTCRGGELVLGFWVRAAEPGVAKAAAMNLSITPDGGGPSFAQDMPLIHGDGTMMVVRGPVARQWAAIAQRAKSTLQVAFVHRNARGALETYNANSFGAAGSSAAIRQVLDRCG
ncbi:MAG: hypothetical protein ACTHLT_19480 [Devosia sp.]